MKELCENQIKATDREIDQFVYKLYNITDEEQKIIEGTK
jgi:type II restriction/modification system DNA methylase subunit YeeA